MVLAPAGEIFQHHCKIACAALTEETPMDEARETVSVEYPADVRRTLGGDKDEFAHELKMLAAVKLYELGRISSGKAAALAGLDRVSFLLALGRYRVSVFNYAVDEVEREIAEAKARAHG
jgi:predicted HTH domain antitoxin